MSNPVYRWLYEGVPGLGIPASLPTAVLRQATDNPQAHPSAADAARAELGRRGAGLESRVRRLEELLEGKS